MEARNVQTVEQAVNATEGVQVYRARGVGDDFAGIGIVTAGCAVPGTLTTMAYTRLVVSLAYQLTCIAMAVALSGSPAVLSACLVICLHGATAEAATDGATAGRHGQQMGAAAHAGHRGHAGHTARAGHLNRAVATQPASSRARLGGVAENCCPNGPIAFTAAPAVERSDTGIGGLAAGVPAVPFQAVMVAFAVTPPRPPVSPPAPAGAPLALRI